jgi:hypothetical protein
VSGQPSKRRRLNKERKPRGEVTDVIADALQVKMPNNWIFIL